MKKLNLQQRIKLAILYPEVSKVIEYEQNNEIVSRINIPKGDRGNPGPTGKNGYTPIKGVDYFDGETISGYTPIKGKDYFDGKPGKDYVLTESDKKEIASLIDIPIIEKVIERTEIIKELPVVTNQVIKESSETLDSLRKKLDPVLREIYASLRGKNYGGFIETGLKAGANVSISKDSSGSWVISSTASGGGGGSGFQAPLTGVIDGSNQTYTWATAPKVIVVDGAPLQNTDQNGDVNWTGTTTTVLTNAPTRLIFAIA